MSEVTHRQERLERKREVQQHLGHLDALRGWAVLGVILIHTGQAFLHTGQLLPGSQQAAQDFWYDYLFYPGLRGVQLFFVVSAFTLLLSAQRRVEEPRPKTSFFLRRYFRLAPLYYPFLLLAFYTVPALRILGWGHTWPALFFLHNFWPRYYHAGTYGGWSLGVEAIFYACFPLLVARVTTLKRAIITFAVAAAGTTLLWHAMVHLDRDLFAYWGYFSFVVEFPVFLFGFVAYFLWRDHLSALRGTDAGKWVSASLLVLAAISFLNVVPIDAQKTMFSSIFCVPLLLSVSLYAWRPVVNRVTVTLGKLSYSMYLIHGALVWTVTPHVAARYPWLLHHAHPVLWALVAYGIITVTSAALATLTYRFIEEPGIVLGRRVVRWVQHRPAQTASTALPPLASPRDTPDAQF